MLLTAIKYKEMLIYGAEILNARKEEVNNLNVFPVPDGDTGSNMNMTIQSGVSSILNSNYDDIGELTKVFSKGLLMGARGNSGVILSQFFRGIAEGLEGKSEVSILEFHSALQLGVKRAYSSVIKAVEGTILTVCREMVENTDANFDSFELYFEKLLDTANISLENTPNLLPVLKEVGVVDSGGAGLVYIFEGMLANLKGETIKITQNFENFMQSEEHPIDPDEIEFGFCTEMLIQLNDPEKTKIEKVRAFLEKKGDSIVAIIDEDILKTHVHTEDPVSVFEYGMTLGSLMLVKSENMRIQAIQAQEKRNLSQKEIGLVTVASSKRMADLFREIQNIEVIEGGQTLNPSIEDITKAIKRVNAKKVIVLPNNSNIIMAAQAAKDLIEDVEVGIVPTKQMTQAIECLVNFNLDYSFEENLNNMQESLENIVNYEVTNAIKDTSINGVEIKKDDFLSIKNGNIVDSIKDETSVVQKIVDESLSEDAEILNILVGSEGNVRMVEKMVKKLKEKSPFMEVNVYNTNQPVYSYLISYLV